MSMNNNKNDMGSFNISKQDMILRTYNILNNYIN